MYDKDTLELKDVRQLLQSNQLMKKKTDSTEDASELFVKGQRGRSKSRGPKRDPKASSRSFATFARNQDISKRIV